MKFRTLVIIAIFVSVLGLAPSKIANATSDYDDIVQPVHHWRISDGAGNTYDTDIQQAIDDTTFLPQKINCQSQYDIFKDLEYKAYSIIRESRYNEATYMYAVGSDDLPEETVWSSEGPTKRAHAHWDNVVIIPLRIDPDTHNVYADNCGNTIGSYADISFAMRWNDGFTSMKTYMTDGFELDYPSGYAGQYISDGTGDHDTDSLTAYQELSQGTSDDDEDTDNDGLNDYLKSTLYPDRDDIFCGTECAYPDPLKKDLYIEIDWTDDGTEEYKPTPTQLGLVADKYEDLGINFHGDIGQYGGGNELTLPSYEASIDVSDEYYSYKWGYLTSNPANFDEARYRVWHYMITGYDIAGSTNSGVGEIGGDDTFLSFGRLNDNPTGYGYSNFDNAVAGSIVHELGHNLCLSPSSSYVGQSTTCVHGRIDFGFPTLNYQSAMNYDYQFTNAYSYSDGSHGTDDHDDLNAINLGFNDFIWNDDDTSVGGPF